MAAESRRQAEEARQRQLQQRRQQREQQAVLNSIWQEERALTQ
jgi:hypothetical protein